MFLLLSVSPIIICAENHIKHYSSPVANIRDQVLYMMIPNTDFTSEDH